MKEADRSQKAADTKWASPGPGMYITFRCGACSKVKSCIGRKLKRVMGLRQYVCEGCAK